MMVIDAAVSLDECRRIVVASGAITVADYDSHIARGAQPYAARLDGQVRGAFLLRVDVLATGRRELVIVAAGGDPGSQVMRRGLVRVQDMASRLDCQSVRFHTRRRGLVRLGELAGFRETEYVMRREVNG